MLQDTQFGMYYGNLNHDGVGIFTIVLSDARCYQDNLDSPYLDSEGDMVVLNIRVPELGSNAEIVIPSGEYPVTDSLGVNHVDATTSYVKRLVGDMQSRWDMKSGTVSVSRDEAGGYSITAKDMVISKGEVTDTVDYVCCSSLKIQDYLSAAPGLLTLKDDIINVPFPNIECIYYGDLYGSSTGNFVVNLYTKDFVTPDNEIADGIPGIYMTLNFFSRYYAGGLAPVLEEGRYNVSSTANSSTFFQRWTIFPGLYLDSTPFGSYVGQRDGNGEEAQEFITSGYVDVSYEESASVKASSGTMMVLNYDLKTSTRAVKGIWKGEVKVSNQASSSGESFLTTLTEDVECDMSKVTTGGTLRHIETLHRKNVEEEWDYDIAEAWQLYLAPRDWSEEEYAVPWTDKDNPLGHDGIEGTEDDYMYDKNDNGIRDRLEAYCADGDVMVLEFILPLESGGKIAPEIGREYTYTMQPDLAIDAEMYEIYVSRMGRPNDEIFDAAYAKQYPGWAEGIGIESYDRCNARRGFTWSEDGWRGNWYMHYETGRHQILDGYAPAINGWVKVKQTSEGIYDFEWDFIDDYPEQPNKITGSIKDCPVRIHIGNL